MAGPMPSPLRARANAAGVATLGRQARLALLRDHDLFSLRHLAERLRHGTVMSAGADDDRSHEDAALAHHAHPGPVARDRGDPRAVAHVGAGGARALQEMVIELAPHDAVARGSAPSRLVAGAGEREAAGGEGLDGERILLG